MEKTKRYFTQRELEKHINARLIRERKKNQDLEVLKSMVDTLLDEGRINANSYAEAAKALMAMIAEGAVGNKEDTKREITEKPDRMKLFVGADTDTVSEKNAVNTAVVPTEDDSMYGISPDMKTINANSYAEAAKVLMAMIAGDAVGNKEEESTKTAENVTKTVSDEDMKVFPNKNGGSVTKSDTVSEDDFVDREDKLLTGEDVRKGETQTAENISPFGAEKIDMSADRTADDGNDVSAENGKTSDNRTRLTELCRELLGILEKSAKEQKKADDGFYARRDICSTGFSKTGSGEDMRLAQSLTPTQREIARRAGLSYREYAELLREIPENTRKIKQMR